MGIFDAFRAGKALKNAETWANKPLAAQYLASILFFGVSVSGLLGYRIDVDAGTVQDIATGLAGIGFLVFNLGHHATNPNAGLPSAPEPRSLSVNDSSRDAEPPGNTQL